MDSSKLKMIPTLPFEFKGAACSERALPWRIVMQVGQIWQCWQLESVTVSDHSVVISKAIYSNKGYFCGSQEAHRWLAFEPDLRPTGNN